MVTSGGEGEPGPTWSRGRRAVDLLLALAVWAGYGYVLVVAAFTRRDWAGTVGYGLPPANLVARGALSMPQLGAQMGLDRYWLLNAPWVVVGPVPWMWALGPGRVPNLVGLVALGLAGGAATAWAVRRCLGLRSWGLAALGALPFLLHRSALVEFDNQRYTAVVFPLMTLAFLPPAASGRVRTRAWWQGLAAGFLTLVHPALIPAAGAWLLAEGAARVRGRGAKTETETGAGRPAGWGGLAAFAAGAALTALWFGRPAGLREQFLPHLRFGNFRRLPAFVGLFWGVDASPVAGVPSRTLNLLLALLALGITAAALTRSGRRRFGPVVLPAALVAALVPVDALRGFLYFPYYLLGLGPCLLAAFGGAEPGAGRARRAAVGVLAALALANAAVSARLERRPPDFTTTAQCRNFIVSATRPGDRLVLGPPFVLATAEPNLPGGRSAVRVVPMDYYLGPFDRATFARDIREHCDVYVGAPEWFTRPVWVRAPDPSDPILSDAEVTRHDFRGQPVIVARQRRR